MPDELVKMIKCLKYTSVQIDYYSDDIKTTAHWIYYPDKEKDYHRILVRKNFCERSRGYWTETNVDRVKCAERKEYTYRNKYAYPLNTIGKNVIMKEILKWCAGKHIYGLGRWGEHQHYNSDVTVSKAISLADRLMTE